MKIIFLRHGESARNAGHAVLDFENGLTIKGVKQVVAKAEELTKTKIDTVYCSSAKRCEQTLDEILRVREDDMPIHMSTLLGPKMSSESLEKLKSRVELFLDDLKYDHQPEETILVISHKMVIEMAVFLANKKKIDIQNGELFEVIL